MKTKFISTKSDSKIEWIFMFTIIYFVTFSCPIFAQEQDTNRLNIPIDLDMLSLNKPNPSFYDIMRIMDKNNVGDTTEGSYYKQLKKAEILWHDRLFPTGQTMQMGAAVTDYVKKFNSGQITSCDNQIWSELGPIGNPGYGGAGTGQIHAIKCSPNYIIDKTVYAASNWGGLYKSVNLGPWQNLNTDKQLPFTSVSDLVIDPTNTQHIYITTGDAEMSMGHFSANLDATPSQRTPLFTAGVFRSTNGGTTWHHINGGTSQPLLDDFVDGGTIRKILIHPSNNSILFIATSKGVYKCINATATTPTWTKIFTPLNDTELKGLEFKPNDPNTIYVSGRDIYRSINGGLSWLSMTGPGTGLDLNSLPTSFLVGRINITVTSANTNVVYAYIVGKENIGPNKLFIFKYENNNWTQKHNMLQTGSLNSFITPTRTAIKCLQNNENFVIFGTSQLRGSQNIGISNVINLSSYNGSGIHADIHAIEFIPGENKIFVGSDGGVHIKNLDSYNTSGGSDFSQGLAVKTIYGFDDSNNRGDRIMIGSQDTGTDVYVGSLWSNIAEGDGHTGKNDDKTGLGFGRSNSETFSYNWDTGAEETEFYNSDPTYINVPNDPATNTPIGMNAAFQMKNHPLTEKMVFTMNELFERKKHEQANNTDNAATLWELKSDVGKIVIPQWQRQLKEFDISSSNPNWWLIALSGTQADLTNNPYIVEPKLLKSIIGGCAGLTGYQTTTCFTDITQNLINSGVSNSSYQAVNGGPSTIIPIITSVIFHPENHLKAWVTFTGYEPSAKVWGTNDGGNTWYNADPNGTLNNLPVNDIVYQKGTNDRLYIGTDAGIYYRDNSSNNWTKFCNFPNVMVTELKINYCLGKLRASTFGRGVWEGELLNSNGNIGNDALEITSNVTWNASRGIDRNIRIKPGGTLNITGNMTVISIPKDGRIIIEQGGRLNVTDAKLTNNCGKTWGSIEIWGNSNLTQSFANQGALILNNATIEHAIEAVIVSKDGGTQFNGGIIQATNTKFFNNKRSVSFYKYELQNNISYFTSCIFKSDDNYRHSQSLLAHMTMWAVKGINISGCNFENIKNFYWDQTRETGIGTVDASSTVTEYCASGTNPCPGAIKSTFKGLTKGINAQGTTGISSFNVYKSVFENNVKGIISTAINNFNIRANTFTVGKTTVGNFIDHEGVSIFAGTGFNVDQNSFSPTFTSLSQPKTVGIRCTDTGLNNKEIYKNTFFKSSTSNTNVFCANLSNGQNRNTQLGNSDGLKYFCNNNTNNIMSGYDFAVQDLSPYLNLGVSSAQGSLVFPARNTFSLGTNISSSDFNNGASTGFINYYHRVGYINEIPTNKFQVNNFGTGTNTNYCYDRYGGVDALTLPDENSYDMVVAKVKDVKTKIEEASKNNDETLISRLSQEILDINREKFWLERDALQYYMNADDVQNLIKWLNKIGDFSAKMSLIDLYISKDDIRNAETNVFSLLDEISKIEDNDGQMINFINLKTLQINALKEKREINLTLNIAERSFLEKLAQNDRGMGGYQARNILNFLGSNYFIDSVFPDNNEWRSIKTEKRDFVNTSILASPNPASNLVNFTYDLGEIKAEGTQLKIVDFMGKAIQNLSVLSPSGTITWDCSFVPTGIYYYSIVKNEQLVIKSKSVIVIK